MGDSRTHFHISSCIYCNSQLRQSGPKSASPFSTARAACPHCGRMQPSRPLELQDEHKRLSERIDLLNRRLASLQNNSIDFRAK